MKNHPDPSEIAARIASALQRATLPSGRALTLRDDDDGTEYVEVRAPSGMLELTLAWTPEGLRLHVEAAEISLRAHGTLSADCARLDLRARESAVLSSPETTVESTRGDLALRANDDVRADGERVLLNCDREDQVPGWMESALGASLREPGSPGTPAGR